MGGTAQGTYPATDISQTGTTWTDMTGLTQTNIPDGMYWKCGFRAKYVGDFGYWRIVNTDDSSIIFESSNVINQTSYKGYNSSVYQNTTGGDLNIKIQCKNDVGDSTWIEEDSWFCHYAPYKNTADDNRKMSIVNIEYVGSSESIFGVAGQSQVVTTQNVNAMPANGIEWSGNSGNMIYAWTGVLIGVTT